MNDLVVRGEELAHDVGETTPTSWTPPSNLDFDSYQKIGRTFQTIQKSLNWWLGDYLNFGEQKFGEMYAQVVEDTGRAVESLMKYKSTSDRIPKEIRQESLSWVHHFYVAYIEVEHRGPSLELALNVGLSSRELKEVAKLGFELRADLIAAAREGMEHNTFMDLLNKFKLGEIKPSTPKKEKELEIDPEDEEIPFTDLDDEDDDGARPVPKRHGLDSETVMDFWENNNAPLTFCGPSEAIWDGILVRAAQDDDGRLILVWEEMLT